MRYLFTTLALLYTTSLFATDPDSTFTVDIDLSDNQKILSFELFNYEDSDVIGTIKYWDNNQSPLNAIVLLKDDFAHYIEFDDYNFDGYLDMYVHDPCMILGNCFGKVYIFENNRYKHDPQFNNMTTVIADPESKEIFSSNRSAAGSIFTNETFKWQGDILILTKRVSQNYDGDYYIYTVEELSSDGTLKITKQERLSEPRLD